MERIDPGFQAAGLPGARASLNPRRSQPRGLHRPTSAAATASVRSQQEGCRDRAGSVARGGLSFYSDSIRSVR